MKDFRARRLIDDDEGDKEGTPAERFGDMPTPKRRTVSMVRLMAVPTKSDETAENTSKRLSFFH